MRSNAGISVMFMTFIAVSILSMIFISYYLYLTQHNLSASEVQRIYAEAAQENLEVILDRRAGELLINNTGGIGVVLKYLVCLDLSGSTANIHELEPLIIIPIGGAHQLPIPSGFSCSPPEKELYVMTERGNLFKAIPGGYHFELEASPSNITLGNGSSTLITLKLKAILLETPEQGTILIVGDPEGCRMTTTTTRAQIANVTYNTMTIAGGGQAITGYICTTIIGGGGAIPCFGWQRVTVVAATTDIPITMIGVAFTTETVTRSEKWVETPEPLTLTFTTKTRTTITTPITINARVLDFWDEAAGCFIWFRVLNATSGSKLAEAGVKVNAGTP